MAWEKLIQLFDIFKYNRAATATHNDIYIISEAIKDSVEHYSQPIATGEVTGSNYLRDDNTWQPVPGGSGVQQFNVRRIIRR